MTNAPRTVEPAAAVPAPDSLWAAWRWWLPPALLTLILALLFLDPFAGDWDALDYTVLALRGEPSSMLFGRILFIYANHVAFKLAHALAGLPAEHAYLLFKYMVVCESPLAVVGMWAMTRRLTGSVQTATVAALLLALSPFFILYSGQAMTEIPSILLLTTGLTLHLRAVQERRLWLVVASAALLGLGVNVRESVALYGVWVALAPFVYRWRLSARTLLVNGAACALFIVCALGPFAYYYFGDVGGYHAAWHGWVASMHAEETVHPVTLYNFVPLTAFFFLAAPVVVVALPVAAYREWRARGFTPPLVLAFVGLLANIMLITHYSTVINGRYLLTGLPGTIPLVAAYLLRAETARTGNARRSFQLVVGGVVLMAAVIGAAFFPHALPTARGHGLTKEYRAHLAHMPDDAVVLAGGQTVAVTYYRGIGLGRWEVIGTGGGWPGARLPEVIDDYLRQGRRVFLDADPRYWFNDSWRGAETRQVVALQERFNFRRITDTIYEIRPGDDATAHDDPNLQRLLDKPVPPLQRFKPR